MEKLKQLSKYIEPLRRMINKIDKNEGRSPVPQLALCSSADAVFLNRQEEGPEQDEEPAQHPDRSHHQVRRRSVLRTLRRASGPEPVLLVHRCPLKTLQKCEIALEKLKNDMAVVRNLFCPFLPRAC